MRVNLALYFMRCAWVDVQEASAVKPEEDGDFVSFGWEVDVELYLELADFFVRYCLWF